MWQAIALNRANDQGDQSGDTARRHSRELAAGEADPTVSCGLPVAGQDSVFTIDIDHLRTHIK